MNLVRGLLLATRFGAELFALWAFGYWGFRTGQTPWVSWGLALAAPLGVALLWGRSIAPKARVPWSQTVKDILGFVVFALAALALHSVDRSLTATTFLLIALVDTGGLLVIPGPPRCRDPLARLNRRD